MKAAFLTLPIELRSLIYDFCFPPRHTRVQLIPYYINDSACQLKLPLSLYLVCKTINRDLPELSQKVQCLDLLYIIQGNKVGRFPHPSHLRRVDDDRDLHHFRKVMQYAERVRMVGGIKRGYGRASYAHRCLIGGPTCALKVLEVQPIERSEGRVIRTLKSGLGTLLAHPDLSERLEILLIRDDGKGLSHDIDATEESLRQYQALLGGHLAAC